MLVDSLTAPLASVVGAPVRLELLEHGAGGRATFRARGPGRIALVEVFEEGGASAVAERIASLADGPYKPRIPEVWAATDTFVALSDVGGRPIRAAALAGDEIACARAGAVLASWHWHWRDRAPDVLRRHTLEQELEVLRGHAEAVPERLAAAVRFGVRSVEGDREWPAATVVHGRLSHETLLLGRDVALVRLDRAGVGPPELDVGNLCGQLELLARRYGRSLAQAQRAFLDGYLSTGAPLDLRLLLTCRSLALLRLGCVHGDFELAMTHTGSAWPPPPQPA
jgi:hypothetical protein